jgi:D-aspartate ligase
MMYRQLKRQEMSGQNDEVVLDRTVPVLVFSVSRFPFQYGTLGAIRSLGRAGIDVYLMRTSATSPCNYSRYIKELFDIRSNWRPDDEEAIVARLLEVGECLGRATILLPVDDEASSLAAIHFSRLSKYFIRPRMDPQLPGTLASKWGLYRLCIANGVPTPLTTCANSASEAFAAAEQIGYPVVVKNSEPWLRLTAAVCGSTTRISTPEDLQRLAENWKPGAEVVVQEFIPDASAEDWIVHAYCGRDGDTVVAYAGRKFRSWPPRAGVTTAAMVFDNEELCSLARSFCSAVGYRGIADMDWRYDRRDGKYKLVDFNPRLGANFRLFVTPENLDVVRAIHLDLTSRKVPAAGVESGRTFKVENLDWAAWLRTRSPMPASPGSGPRSHELAWFAIDDLLPFFVMLLSFGGTAFVRFVRLANTKARRFVSRTLISARSERRRDQGAVWWL